MFPQISLNNRHDKWQIIVLQPSSVCMCTVIQCSVCLFQFCTLLLSAVFCHPNFSPSYMNLIGLFVWVSECVCVCVCVSVCESVCVAECVNMSEGHWLSGSIVWEWPGVWLLWAGVSVCVWVGNYIYMWIQKCEEKCVISTWPWLRPVSSFKQMDWTMLNVCLRTWSAHPWNLFCFVLSCQTGSPVVCPRGCEISTHYLLIFVNFSKSLIRKSNTRNKF